MSSLFISYSHSDGAFARKLASDLRDHGHTVWIDEAKILVGDSFIDRITEAIETVEFFATILSVASIDSSWAKKELDLAMNREIGEKRVFVLPILLTDVEIPGFLKGKMYADFRSNQDYQEGLGKLLDRLNPEAEPPDLTSSKMALRPYLFIETSHHGYLRVPQSEIEELGISDKITEYSFKDDLYAYLEEDCDLVAFIEAKEQKNGEDYDHEEDTFYVYVEKFPS